MLLFIDYNKQSINKYHHVLLNDKRWMFWKLQRSLKKSSFEASIPNESKHSTSVLDFRYNVYQWMPLPDVPYKPFNIIVQRSGRHDDTLHLSFS